MNKTPDTIAVDFDPFQGPEIVRLAPAIEPQLELWVACALGGEDANRAYNESVSLRLSGTFLPDAFQKALTALITRHEGLRSVFSADGARICVFKDWKPQFYFEDISGKTATDRETFIRDFARQDANTAFDILNGPLFRTALFKIAANEHYLTLTGHHLVCDGWSLGILMQDLGKLYSAFATGASPNLPAPVQLSQFAVQQWEFSQTEEYREIEDYWLRQYNQQVPILDLPTDFPRPANRTYKSRRDDYPLDTALIAAVKKTGASAGCSLVITLLAAFEIVIHRFTGQEDIVLGLPAAGQSATGNHSLIGHCVNLLPLRSRPTGDQTFTNYLRTRKPAVLDDLDHQLVTFGSLLKKLNIPRDPSRIPFVPVAFNIDMGMDNGVRFEGLQHQLIYNPRAFENFEIFLNASGSESSFVLEWSYNTQLFKPETIAALMEAYTTVLKTLVENPACRIMDFPILPQPTVLLAGPETDYDKESTVTDLFAAQARKTPSSTALIFEDQQYTYRQLDDLSSRLAHFLRTRGVGPETMVPLCIRRSPGLIVSILAILKAGGAYVPIDPEYPLERIRFMLEDINAEFLLADRTSAAKLPEGTGCELLLYEDLLNRCQGNPTQSPNPGTNPSSLAYVIYTSGSTGRPKGAMIIHRNITSLVRGSDYVTFDGTEVILSTGSPSFDATTFEYWGTLLNGGILVLPSEQTLLDTNLLKQTIRSRNISMMWITSSLLNQWINLDITILQGLGTVLAGGEKLSEKHIGLLRRTYPRMVIINGYGPTENTTFSLTYTMTSGEIPVPIPIGRPLSNRSAYILNTHGKLCRPGETGELFVGGAGVGRGYLKRPELTAERFLDDPFEPTPGARMYRTGDLARWLPDGNVEYLGRIDDQVKIRGYRIELGEIESILSQFAGVKDCVVIARDDQKGDKRLIGYIVPEGPFDKTAISAWMNSQLPDYMVPRQWVHLQSIPLTANGKADKRALPDPDLGNTTAQSDNQPHTDLQKTIAAIFAEALRRTNIGLDDDFFELGGHSLIAIQVMKRLDEQTGNRLPITTLFSAPTVRKVAQLLEKEEVAVKWNCLVPIKPEGNKPPLYIVHGSGLTVLVFNSLAKSLSPNQPVYGLQAHGLNGEDPFDSIEDIAAHYIAEILEHNPTGPYNLAGYSFGGIVVFEMARQLTAMGKQISTLAIFDTNADNSDHLVTRSVRWKRKIMRQLPKLRFIANSFVKSPSATLAYQTYSFKSRIRGIFEAIGWVKPLPTEEEQLSPYANRINESHYRALYQYRMQPFNGTIDLFRVTTRLYFLDDPIYLGWKPYAEKGIRIHNIPGDHKTFLLDPNYKSLAAVLQQTLDDRELTQAPVLEVVRPGHALKIV
ncbi:MAG TPA: amino acid adenylation domain-containing protein [Puia sp.]|uniref:non-ribosomal peptide synthetase n=1 Tax=Puia sp. TaxID=2045100 RepID=UPI002C1A420C|nr:amino acid adenylation domain-containing protein [Puia sp.]HVU95092.1 amino acid adenylation domain-containing protein [Puia sp.]